MKPIPWLVTCFMILMIWPTHGQTQIPYGRRFREIVADKYPGDSLFIGAASHVHLLTTATASVLAAEFGYITPANKFKQSYIHPEPGIWRWQDCDTWIAFARKHQQVMRLHAPISPQSSAWVKEDNRSPDELKTMLHEYMTAVCKRFNDTTHIKWLDVVNETVDLDGTWFGPKEGTDSWENPWPRIGYDTDINHTPLYIKYAFEIADSLAPDLKLIINQHGSMDDVIWDKIKATVLYLRNMGLRVDGIGWQAHVDAGWEKTDNNIQRLKALIEWAHANNLEFHVTENNSWVRSWEVNTPEKMETRFNDQSETFAAIVRTLLPYRKTGVVTWNLWHIEDDQAQGFQWDKLGCMWTEDGKPKPAYYAVQQVLEMGEDSTRYSIGIDFEFANTDTSMSEVIVSLGNRTDTCLDNSPVLFTDLLPGIYQLQIQKNHFETIRDEHFYVYKDSVYTFSLSPKAYQVTLLISDRQQGHAISDVSIEMVDTTYTTNFEGKSTISLIPGAYDLFIDAHQYLPLDTSVRIQSDTTINFNLTKSLGTLRFRLLNNSSPVNNVQVLINEETLISNALGICEKEDLAFHQTYGYQLSKHGYKPIQDSIWLTYDTTLWVEMQKTLVDIRFYIYRYSRPVKDVQVRLNNDFAETNSDGMAAFYDLPVDSVLTYKIYDMGEFWGEGFFTAKHDTTINLSLESTLSGDNILEDVCIYPNPAKDFIFVKVPAGYRIIKLYDTRGRLIDQWVLNDQQGRIPVHQVPEGLYYLGFFSDNPALQEKLRIINIF